MVTEKIIENKFKEFTITDGDLSVNVLEYGATIHNIFFKGIDCIAGYDNPMHYLEGGSFQGATVGRYANRIGGGKFAIGENTYTLDINDHDYNCLHGGNTSFAKQILKGEIISDNSVKFSHFSKDGDSGFPGNVEFAVTFTVANNTLSLEYEAVSDKDTVLNFTNHAYFTLGADTNKEIVLEIKADKMVPVDKNLVPTGELSDVTGTAFDFRTPKKIGKDLFDQNPLIVEAKGYDHCFVLGDTAEYRENVAVATNPENGITMKCHTDLPGIQLYTGNWLNEKNGKGGNGLYAHMAFCLETELFPDTPNRPEFPSALVKAGEKYTTVTKYKFEA